MLIKSECQPLDKTRHKPTWNLFEQREPCKMAREICSAAWPLNSTHRPAIMRYTSGETDGGNQTDRAMWTGPQTLTYSLPTHGDIRPLTLG